MGVFDKKVDETVFDAYRDEVNSKFESIRQELRNRATDSDEIAKAAANNVIAIENTVRKTGEEVNELLEALRNYKSQATSDLNEIRAEKQTALEHSSSLSEKIANTLSIYDSLVTTKQSIDASADEVAVKIQAIDKHLSTSKTLPEDVKSVQELLSESKTLGDSMTALLNHSLKRKAEIDELHKQIYGQDVNIDDGSSQHIDGTKDELERSYSTIKEQAQGLEAEVKKVIERVRGQQANELENQKTSFANLLDTAKGSVDSVTEQLKNLLPGAMAAGLSAAYDQKKDDETNSLAEFNKVFQRAIIGMICISCIPIVVNMYFIFWEGKALALVIQGTPNLVAAILPIYFPVLWMAYSANKKANLSKRLIEEYTHKSVLGKTFSGLSNQIDSLPKDSSIKDELRTRLLFNVLQVSAENPGKLITNYQKSDHPLMEALENSVRLAESVQSLSKIPGFSAIAKKLSTKSDELLKNRTQQVEEGLETQETLDEPAAAKVQ
ncbi:hypothetical protein [Undibacterium sp.]|jgi:ABC-type phosphate transport system auxiliary subunit|uniref:hypothetical protein n=1 Tax=Undibacterium sp. TaxID=1914977 RepID=UPI002C5D8328|nr:hypothetical protein [Undibacterium sp.]HTD06247.1 hypothetical protein [Undibacterium sp.]